MCFGEDGTPSSLAGREVIWPKETCGVVAVVVSPNILLRSGLSQPSIVAMCVAPWRVLDAFPDEASALLH